MLVLHVNEGNSNVKLLTSMTRIHVIEGGPILSVSSSQGKPRGIAEPSKSPFSNLERSRAFPKSPDIKALQNPARANWTIMPSLPALLVLSIFISSGLCAIYQELTDLKQDVYDFVIVGG
jgi:hypothetical protein